MIYRLSFRKQVRFKCILVLIKAESLSFFSVKLLKKFIRKIIKYLLNTSTFRVSSIEIV